MPFDAGQLVAKLQLDIDGWKASVSTIKRDQKELIETTGKTTDAFSGLWKQIAAGVVAYGLVQKATNLFLGTLKDSIGAALAAEDANAALGSAINSTGKQAFLSTDHFVKYAEALMGVTTYDDEAIKGAQALLIQLTNLNSDGLDVATKGAIGLATVMGTDLHTAARLVAQAMEGNYTMLGRYIPALRMAKDEGEKHNIVMKFMADAYVRATDAAQTTGGQLKSLKNWWTELEESVGGAIIKNDAFQKLMVDVKKVIIDFIASGKLADWATAAVDTIVVLAKTVKIFADGVAYARGVMSGFGSIVDKLANQQAVAAAKEVEEFSKTIDHCAFSAEEAFQAAMKGGKAWDDYRMAIQATNDENKRLEEAFINIPAKVKAMKESLDALAISTRVTHFATGMMADEVDRARIAFDKKQAVKDFDDLMKSLGIKSVPQVNKEILDLRKHSDDLMKSFLAGNLNAKNYAKGIDELYKQMKGLTEEIVPTDAGVNKLNLDIYNSVPVAKVEADLGTMDTDWIAYFSKLHKYRELNYTEEQQRAIDILDITKKTVDSMAKLYGDFGRDVLVAFEKWGSGTEGILKGIGDAFGNLAQSAIKMVEDILASMLEASLKEVFASEIVAIGNVIKSVMALPFPLNLIAVGGAIAAVELLFSKIKHFDAGGVVQAPMLGMLHPNEAVIPLEKMPQIMSQVTNNYMGGGKQKSQPQHIHVKVYLDGDEMKNHTVKTVRRQAELKNLIIPSYAIGG